MYAARSTPVSLGRDVLLMPNEARRRFLLTRKQRPVALTREQCRRGGNETRPVECWIEREWKRAYVRVLALMRDRPISSAATNGTDRVDFRATTYSLYVSSKPSPEPPTSDDPTAFIDQPNLAEQTSHPQRVVSADTEAHRTLDIGRFNFVLCIRKIVTRLVESENLF